MGYNGDLEFISTINHKPWYIIGIIGINIMVYIPLVWNIYHKVIARRWGPPSYKLVYKPHEYYSYRYHKP